MLGIGPTELVIVLIVALLVFGPARLPKIGRAVGETIRETADSLRIDRGDDDTKK
jgi:sec-independent protein translocase protein TatA